MEELNFEQSMQVKSVPKRQNETDKKLSPRILRRNFQR